LCGCIPGKSIELCQSRSLEDAGEPRGHMQCHSPAGGSIVTRNTTATWQATAQGKSVNIALSLALTGVMSVTGFAQANAQTQSSDRHEDRTPIYRVRMISRTVEAVNYQHRGRSTKLDFAGTDLMSGASGEAKVDSKRGSIAIEAEFSGLDRPTSFGTEYLTYVLWAISPEGRSVNLGEVLVGGNSRSKLNVTTNLQAFALIVTAEPYYAVQHPSNVVILENVVRPDTRGTTEEVHAKYELMERGGYLPTGYKIDPIVLNAHLPLEFYEARNAMRIAKSEGAEQYADESYGHAVKLMDTADRYAIDKHHNNKQLIAISREAVQTAEDARTIAVKKMDEARNHEEREDSANALANSQAQTDQATRRTERAQADAANAQSDAARAQSESAQAKIDMAASQQASANAVADAQADATLANNNAQQSDVDKANMRAQRDRERLASADALAQTQAQVDDANRLRDKAQAGQVNAQIETNHAQSDSAQARLDMAASAATSAHAVSEAQEDAAKANRHAAQADSDKAEMRTRLSTQLNLVLQTRDSARGLIVNMSDVLFDTGQYTLKPGAREKLAKVAGILVAYPGINVKVGGYTDNVGSDDMNQSLSEHRAGSVRDYLVESGVNSNTVTAQGFGNTQPVATNDNATGRQQNRRVELVVSGDIIGNSANATTGSLH
jgi:outer membrane protein OmpA-like peptidoglycan-associated protein